MALMMNSIDSKKHTNNSMTNNTNNNNVNKNISLPLTIIPLTEDALKRQNVQMSQKIAPKPPDLTFHCMCCEEYFVNPFHMYEHLNTKHADLPPEPQESEEELDDGKDYSWVFEPLCELVAEDSGQGRHTQQQSQNGDEDDSSSDSDSDDDSSSTSSSTSSSSSSDSSSSNSNSQDETTRDAPELQEFDPEGDHSTMEVMEEAAYEEVEAESLQSNSQMVADGVMDPPLLTPKTEYNPSVLVLNPAANTTITPVLAAVKRGRGRRSAAQQAAIEMSSLISGEPKCFQCSHCEASFPSAGDLSKHVRCHISNKPFQCSICEKTFTHIGSLNTHIRIHSGEKPYKCELCSKAFTQSSSLMVHVRSHSIKKPHQCHLCDKGFVNSTSLAIHLKTHNGEPAISCTECDKTFKHESQLKEHLRMHTLSLVYQCSICRNAFATSSELVQHMKCHMGEKPFTCSICDRSFTQSGSLNIHMRIHTGEKPFNCKFCNKSFTQASSLSVHMKIHSGEKPFPCHICGKSYSQSAYLNKHIQNHLEMQKKGLEAPQMEQKQETLLCIVCGELHKDANSLAYHVTKQHAALLNNMREAGRVEITEEERRRQEMMYMQQIQALMHMQQQQQHMMQQQHTTLNRLPTLPLEHMQKEDEEINGEQTSDNEFELQNNEQNGNGFSENSPHNTTQREDDEDHSNPSQPMFYDNDEMENASNYHRDDDYNENDFAEQEENDGHYMHPEQDEESRYNDSHHSMQQNIEASYDNEVASNYDDEYEHRSSPNNQPIAEDHYDESLDSNEEHALYANQQQQHQRRESFSNGFCSMANDSETEDDDGDVANGDAIDHDDSQGMHNVLDHSTFNIKGNSIMSSSEAGDMHDIEMSEYPFIDDTKFNFYDDYAAEEEVETAE
ncbi:zinc finger protein 287 [Stomoxys calcitrans]|uniref:zinc finger protein 287 n=1 Tax=Stomoxys calcitrans TaxID=35570 RepID=UPI0027E2B9B9|nr:zinc finger protein 287 [Stomoxys calcitrans]XP_013100435.2 zinc finger protein 287 [Stomoxys calcitrans]XP_013100437.2 zinc finger protein 287 [Stomoxys calcitrans]